MRWEPGGGLGAVLSAAKRLRAATLAGGAHSAGAVENISSCSRADSTPSSSTSKRSNAEAKNARPAADSSTT